MKRGAAAIGGSDFAYDEYKRRIDVQAVLDHYGADNQSEQVNRDGTTEVIHSCLLDRVEPHHANGDANPSAAANLDKKLYTCYSYWGGDIFHLIMKMERKEELHDIIDVVIQFLDGSTQESTSFRDSLHALFATQAATNPTFSAYSIRALEPWAFIHPYLAERGVDDETASRLQIGYDPKAVRITIPHFWKGILVGWQKRAIPGRAGEWPASVEPLPKYRSSPGFPKGSTLYGYDLLGAERSRVVVVESPFSVIRSVGRGDQIPVVATFGAKITDAQVALMRDFGEVIVWMDPDDAGARAERRLVNALHHHVKVRVVEPDEDMDLGDYDDSQTVQAKIDNAVPALFKMWEYNKEDRSWARRKQLSAR